MLQNTPLNLSGHMGTNVFHSSLKMCGVGLGSGLIWSLQDISGCFKASPVEYWICV